MHAELLLLQRPAFHSIKISGSLGGTATVARPATAFCLAPPPAPLPAPDPEPKALIQALPILERDRLANHGVLMQVVHVLKELGCLLREDGRDVMAKAAHGPLPITEVRHGVGINTPKGQIDLEQVQVDLVPRQNSQHGSRSNRAYFWLCRVRKAWLSDHAHDGRFATASLRLFGLRMYKAS